MKVHKLEPRKGAATALIAAGLALALAGAAEAQSIMRSPNLNVGTRTPNVTARINPTVVGRAVGTTATIAGGGAGIATTSGNIAGRGTIANTSVANTAVGRTTTNVGSTAVRTTVTTTTVTRTTPNVTTTSVTARVTPNVTTTSVTARVNPTVTTTSVTARVNPTVTTTSVTARVTPTVTTVVSPRIAPTIAPAITPRVAVVLPTLPYVRYSPNLYPACSYALRDAAGDCGGQPVSAGIGSGGGGAAPPRGKNAGAGKGGRNAVQAAINLPYVTDQIVAEVDAAQADELARRHRLTRIETLELPLLRSSLSLFRITDRRSVETVKTELAADAAVRLVQPNFRYFVQDKKSALVEGDPAQYALAKLRLPEAHGLSRGSNVTVAVIDSGIDLRHPELANSISESFDALGSSEGPHPHGTGIAGAIVAHARLMGSAPSAKILAIRAFGAAPNGAQSTSFIVLKSLDHAAARGAQVVNMSFAGPKDPLVERGIAAAAGRGMVLVAASGNAGAKSPPLYPAANPDVIAVSATDASDRLFPASNRGSHIAVAAPGVDIFLPAPDGKYQMASGTSFSAAYISGLAALMMERDPRLKPDAVRAILLRTARDLGAPGRDDLFGAGEADAFAAVEAVAESGLPVAAVAGQPATAMAGEAQAVAVTPDLGPTAIAAPKPADSEAGRPEAP